MSYTDLNFLLLFAVYREGTESTKGKLEIVEFVERSKSDAPEFLKKIGDEMVFRGMAARFTALVTGIPEPEYEWVFNGRPLFPTDRYDYYGFYFYLHTIFFIYTRSF